MLYFYNSSIVLLHEDPRHISFLNRYHCALSPNNPLLISGNPHLLLLKLNLKQLSNDISTINRSEGGWKNNGAAVPNISNGIYLLISMI